MLTILTLTFRLCSAAAAAADCLQFLLGFLSIVIIGRAFLEIIRAGALCGLGACSAMWFICWSLIPYLFCHLFYLPPYLFTSLRIGLFHFRTGGRKRRQNMALVFFNVFWCYSLLCVIVYFVTDTCLLFCVRISSSVLILSQIAWEERLWDYLFVLNGTKP